MDLERELRALRVEWPVTPVLALELRRRRRRWPLAVAIALAAIAVAFAVPQSRASILHFFDIGRVHVRLVDTLPPAQERPLTAGLGRRVSLQEARVDFPGLLLPATASVPALYLAHGNVLSLVFEHEGEPVLLSELLGGGGVYAKKLAAGSTGIDQVHVGDAFGLWLSGSPHVFFTPQAFLAAGGKRSCLGVRLHDVPPRRPQTRQIGGTCDRRVTPKGVNRSAGFPEVAVSKVSEMTAVQEIIETEQERVERWRAEELMRAGYDPASAHDLASRPDIDLHGAIALLERGCPADLAVQILL